MSRDTGSEAEHVLPAVPSSVSALRHHVLAFSAAVGVPAELQRSIALAVSEVISNAVLHAYREEPEPGPVRVRCWSEDGRLLVEVADDGRGMTVRDDSPGLGHGLAAVGALAQTLEVTAGPDGRGTVVRMSFADRAPTAATAAAGLEALCALGLESVADVACLDVIGEGVLRRVAAEVAGDPERSAWLLGSTPPAKPGTATWAAMREGGARLVVHDPSVERSPGGPGERLGLTWWIAVPLVGADGAPAALWGMGGRAGGRPVPSDAVVAVLVDAARGDLGDPARRERLRAALR